MNYDGNEISFVSASLLKLRGEHTGDGSTSDSAGMIVRTDRMTQSANALLQSEQYVVGLFFRQRHLADFPSVRGVESFSDQAPDKFQISDYALDCEGGFDLAHAALHSLLLLALKPRVGKAGPSMPIAKVPSSHGVISGAGNRRGGCRSEWRELFNVLNRRTERESSEHALISLKVLADFDSTMRRFESSRPSQPVLTTDKPYTQVTERRASGGLLRFGVRSLCSRMS
jgi:hypothetical protein